MTVTRVRSQILVATDGSEHADHGLRIAHRWAHARGHRLTIMHVVQHQKPMSMLFPVGAAGVFPPLDDLRAEATADLHARVQALTGRTFDDYDLVVATGTPHVEIVRIADLYATVAIVLGARGSEGLARLLLGHTAAKVASHAHCPVFIARPGPHTGHVMVATDLSDDAGPPLYAAQAYARAHGCSLSAVYVAETTLPFPLDEGSGVGGDLSVRLAIRDTARAQLEAHLQRFGVEATPIVVESPTTHALVTAAEKFGAELLVMGTHGRTGLSGLALGNTASSVLDRVSCSVMVLRTDDVSMPAKKVGEVMAMDIGVAPVSQAEA